MLCALLLSSKYFSYHLLSFVGHNTIHILQTPSCGSSLSTTKLYAVREEPFFFVFFAVPLFLSPRVCMFNTGKRKLYIVCLHQAYLWQTGWGGFALMCSNMRLRTDAGRHG